MSTERRIISLPEQFSTTVNDSIEAFVEQHKEDGVKSLNRWQDSDLWLIWKEKPVQIGDISGTLQTRVTVGTYEGDATFSPDLIFLSDILLMTSEGRYILPPEKRSKENQITIPLREIEDTDQLRAVFTAKLGEALEKAALLSYTPEEANVLLP